MNYIGKLALCLFITIVVSSYSNNFNSVVDNLKQNGFEIGEQTNPIVLYVFVNIISIVIFDIVILVFSYVRNFSKFVHDKFNIRKVKMENTNWEIEYQNINKKYEHLRMKLKEIINHFITLLQEHKVSINSKDLMGYIKSINNHIDKADFNIIEERCKQLSKTLIKNKDMPSIEKTNDNFIKRETK